MAEEALAPLKPSRLSRRAGLGSRISAALLALFLSFAVLAAPPKKNPSWSDLTAEQQQILRPLAGEWGSLDAARRTKWIGIAKRYPGMTGAEQNRVQARMAEWVKLTPDERRNAREQYRKIGKLPPGKREVVSQHWEEYQQLPESVKKGLAVESKKKKTERIEPRSRSKTAQAKPPPPAAVEPEGPEPAVSTLTPPSTN